MNKTNVKINIYLHTYIFINYQIKYLVNHTPRASFFTFRVEMALKASCEVSKRKKQTGSEKERMSTQNISLLLLY